MEKSIETIYEDRAIGLKVLEIMIKIRYSYYYFIVK
jgi:hypothetical protein